MKATHVLGIALRLAPRLRVHIGFATARYWTWGLAKYGVRTPVLNVRFIPGTQFTRLIRLTHLRWYGPDKGAGFKEYVY